MIMAFRKVKVVHIVPGSEPPVNVDYWWEQEHDRRFYTFMDNFPAGSARQLRHTINKPRVCKHAHWSCCSLLCTIHSLHACRKLAAENHAVACGK